MSWKIPFCEHIKSDKFQDISFAKADLTGNAKYGTKVKEEISNNIGDCDVFLTPSGSAALEMGVILLDLGPGDEVIMPSFTFTSTANAVLLRGATPVFVDIKEGCLDIDEKLVEKSINEKTKCIMPVFYGGASSNIDKLERISKQKNVKLFPDAAQAIGSYYNNKPLGGYGDLSAFSFHQTKNIACGEGGALIVNDKSLTKKAEIIQEKGTNRSEFFRGEVDKYSWKDIGSSYLMSELCSAYLYDPICRIDEITKRRRQNWDYYYDNLLDLEKSGKISLPKYSKNCNHNGHIFFVQFEDDKKTEDVRILLNKAGILAVKHYYPLHMTEIAKNKCKLGSKMNVTEKIYDRILRLPLYDHILVEQQDYVIKSLKELL